MKIVWTKASIPAPVNGSNERKRRRGRPMSPAKKWDTKGLYTPKPGVYLSPNDEARKPAPGRPTTVPKRFAVGKELNQAPAPKSAPKVAPAATPL